MSEKLEKIENLAAKILAEIKVDQREAARVYGLMRQEADWLADSARTNEEIYEFVLKLEGQCTAVLMGR